ncbi:Endonuclease/exonuclease/phosphatase [Forsythia ovata]|uniref:Endonuclease/exonuclease/phosphatase n=1 Tax=Forsythia ovata TaxID=205694 RepID=A0ABD1WUS2_9LAMI
MSKLKANSGEKNENAYGGYHKLYFQLGGSWEATPPIAMSLLCWNALGLGGPWELNCLQRAIRENSLNLVFIIETKLFGSKAKRIRNLLGILNCFHLDNKGSGEIFFLWTNNWVINDAAMEDDSWPPLLTRINYQKKSLETADGCQKRLENFG